MRRPADVIPVLMAAEQLTQILLWMSEPSSQIQHVVVALNLSGTFDVHLSHNTSRAK